MRQQRVKMSQFDRNALLQYHQQAITHALAPQQSQKQMPAQLVFPDDTMAIGSPAAVARGVLFPTDAESAQETEEQRQRRLLQNEPIVVYTSLSEDRVILPVIGRRCLGLLLVVILQASCIMVILTGGSSAQFYDVDDPTPSASQAGLYVAFLALHVFFLLSMYVWSADMVTIYSVLVTLLFVLTVVYAVRSVLDVAACGLCVPAILLSISVRDLMMPHCLTIRASS